MLDPPPLIATPIQMDSRNVVNVTGLLDGRPNLDDRFSVDSSDSEGEHGNQSVDASIDSSQMPTQMDSNAKKSQRTRNFAVLEDILLISAWLNISMDDTVQGNDQKKATYWERIWEYFHKHKTFDSHRTGTSLMHRWSSIQIAVKKFCECYTQVEARRQSGVTELDMILQAKHLYQELYHVSFQFEHCWNELRYQPKWIEKPQKKKPKVHRNPSPGASASTPLAVNLEKDNIRDDTPVDLERQPLGNKAENQRLKKRKNKERISGRTEGYVLMLLKEIKEERRQMNQWKKELMEKSFVQEKEKLSLEQKKLCQEVLKEEERIMSVDTSGMSSIQAEYYRLRQMEILEKVMGSNLKK